MTFIYFAIVLGVTIFIHELGHFLFAKRSGIYVYEFAIGMGPQIFKFTRKKDETVYSIRLFPIGGFVQMAGESIEEDQSIPRDRQFQSKSWINRFLTIIAGILFNFILAIILLFVVGLLNGVPKSTPSIAYVDDTYPAYQIGLRKGDQVLKINGHQLYSVDQFLLELQVRYGKQTTLTVKHKNGQVKELSIQPIKNKEAVYKFGFAIDGTKTNGIIASIQYGFTKTLSLVHQMVLIIYFLITQQLGLSNLAGPVGIYSIVGDAAKAGLVSMLYLIALISINVGFINLLPIPAFDGGRLLFLIIEKIKGKPVNQKVENLFHRVGFILLMLLMLIITYNDIIKLFK